MPRLSWCMSAGVSLDFNRGVKGEVWCWKLSILSSVILSKFNSLKLAPWRGIEPLTYPLGGDRSIQLSYQGARLWMLAGLIGGKTVFNKGELPDHNNHEWRLGSKKLFR